MKLVQEITLKNIPKRKKAGVLLLGLSGALLILGLRDYLGISQPEHSGFYYGALACTAIATAVLHEGLHGLLFKAFTGKVRFGVKLMSSVGPCGWASSPGSLIPRAKFQVIALAPQALSILLLAILIFASNLLNMLAYMMLLAIALNIGGGCFDFYAWFLLRKYPRATLIEDTIEGCKIYKWEEE